jgi:hypothetical protein
VNPRTRRAGRVAALAVVGLLVGCSSVGEEGATSPQATTPTTDRSRAVVSSTTVPPAGSAPPTAAAVPGISATTTTIPPFGDADAPPVTATTEQRFEGPAAEDWTSEGWASEAAGSGEAVVTKGVGRMVVDPRGTYEWVRAVGVVGPYEDLDVEATMTPRSEALGSVYVGLRGNGNWRGSTPYLPSVGVALEYAFSPGIESELRIYQISDAGGVEDRGAVPVAPLRSGETGRIRVSLDGMTLRAKVWRDGQPEPSAWALERTVDVAVPGSIHLAYRDEPG